jgi:PPP family 3-phenylpropionic acid transporter
MPAASVALFWFLYFGGLGIFLPYYSLYLRENAGLGGMQVGVVLAMLPLVGIFAQPLWGHLADRTGARSRVLVLVTIGAAAGFAAVGGARGFVALLLATAGLAFFATAVLPLSMSVAFAAVRTRGPYAFGLVRVWGTIGYLVLVVCFPWMLHRWQSWQGLTRGATGPSEPGLELMFAVIAGLALAAAAVGPALPRGGAVELRAGRGEWRDLLRAGPMLRLLLFGLGCYLCLQGPMAFFPVYIRAQGGSLDTIGRMWVVMLLLEIPLVALSGAGLRRLGARGLLGVGAAAGGLRWAVCGLTGDLRLVYAVQLLHGVVVTGLLLGGPMYIEAIVPERLRSTGQALFAMAGLGIGGILSNTLAGWLLEHAGARAPYLTGGLGALALGLAVSVLLPPAERRPAPS